VFWLVIFLLLLLISSYFIYKIIKQRKQRELEKAELLAKVNESNLKSLQGQMNPHFVFNSLSTLQNLVLNQKDAEVLEYISEFSKLMRTMLDNSRNDIISLIDEIEFLKNYIDLEHIRYKNGFDVIWTNLLSEDDFEDIYIPTMLIQPLIENAIKHGVSNLNERRGIIEISLKLINDSLLEIKVSDNGNNTVKKVAKHTSTAIKVIKERLELYQKNNQKGTFELIIQPEGASSIIVIPV
jgi:LytS/YehU family sensor histidine kinase